MGTQGTTARTRRSRIGAGVWALAGALVVASSACGGGSEDAGEDGDTSPDGGETSDTGDTGADPVLGDSCEDTALGVLAPTQLRASLRGATASAELGEACGLTGPTVFVALQVPGRVDLSVAARGFSFTPRLRAQLPGCVDVDDDLDRVLACGEALPVTLFDVGPDAELLLAIGIDADDPALDLPAPEPSDDPEGPLVLDPLDFELDLTLRAVLGQGQLCGPDFGRCEAGTVCLAPAPSNDDPPDEPDEPDEPDAPGEDLRPRCTRPEADSCAAPGEIALAPDEPFEFVIPADEPHSDAHEHPCTGWRRPERVERVTLPANLDADAVLHVIADDPRVGLALRGQSCAPEDALACTPAESPQSGPGSTQLSFGGGGALAQLAAAGEALLLFIELPREDDPGGPAPVTLTLEIAPG